MLFLPRSFCRSILFSLPKRKYFYRKKLSPKQLIHTKKFRSYDDLRGERAWKIPSFLSTISASLTVEAALGMTLFLVFLVSLSQLFLVMQLQLRIQKALEQVGNEAAQYAYFSEQVKWWERDSKLLSEVEEYLLTELSEEALKIRLVDLIGEETLDRSVLRGGAGGISFEESSLFQEQHRLHLVVTYQIDLPVASVGLEPITLQQQCYRYAWLGDQPPSETVETEEQMVYVTKTGEVYHLSLDCTYLTLSVRQITRDQLESLRNDSGAKYYSCELCDPSGWESQLYVTREGTRFHSESDCSGLRRYISALPISQVENRHVCSRCGQEE